MVSGPLRLLAPLVVPSACHLSRCLVAVAVQFFALGSAVVWRSRCGWASRLLGSGVYGSCCGYQSVEALELDLD